MNAALKPRAVYARESIAEVVDEIKPLLIAHYEEIAHYLDIPLKPDYQRYIQAETAGLLRIFTARVDGELVGYAIYLLMHHLHYSDSLQAHQDILYLAPDHRRGGTGMRLIRHADCALAEEGVQVVVQHVKARADLNFGPLLERMGYELMDHIYAKRLD